MVTPSRTAISDAIIYPEGDGKLMADSTLQFRWIVIIKKNLEILFAGQPDVFIAGDLLWYPVEGNNRLCQAPDAMVVFGRPKGERRSYRQWQEADIAPQVVFEILPHSHVGVEMTRKVLFYQQHGVEEYYQYEPENNELIGAHRVDGILLEIADWQNWVSPRLGIRFALTADTLKIYAPNEEPFLTPTELA
ncbi:MAG: Uma2 family endonuclease [Cyanobacteria bacterium P01_C01_bin.120]